MKEPNSVVGTMTRVRARLQGVRAPEEARKISLLQTVQIDSFVQEPFYSMGPRGYFPAAVRLGCDADRSIAHSALVKNENSHSTALLICLHGVYTSIFNFLRRVRKIMKSDC